MVIPSRKSVVAAAAIAATSAAVLTSAMPKTWHSLQLPPRSMETRLVDVGFQDIPVNLSNDILNIPYNELQGGGLATIANSFLFTGTWWVPSSTNLWGIDPGDPTHIAMIDNFVPFTAFTEGFTNAQGVYEPGLNYEFAGLLAAELPVSSSCDAMTCYPMTPPDVITGSTQFDRDIGFFQALSGQAADANKEPFGLFSNWFQVPLQNLVTGYTFGAGTEPTGDPGIIDPSGPVSPETDLGLGWGSSGNPFEGGTGPGDAMPWDGVHYQLNLLQPFQTLYDSLLQQPATNGFLGSGVEVPSFEGVAHTFENLLAGTIIDFDPFTAGSPACPGTCDLMPGMQIPDLVADISKLDPTNTTLAHWVADYAKDPALVNEPTQSQVNSAIALLQTGVYNLTPGQLAEVDKVLASINPALPFAETNAGWYTDPGYLAYTGTGPLNMVYGGYDPNLVAQDLGNVFNDLINGHTNYSELFNPAVWWFLADPLTAPAPAAATEAGASAASTLASSLDPSTFSTGISGLLTSLGESSTSAFDPGGLSADLSALLAGLGTTTGADLLSQLATEFGTQLAADLGTQLPSAMLSAF